MNPRHVDVLVVGGGPAGAAAALTLSRAGVAVLLVHRQGRLPYHVGESLPPAATPLLAELDILGYMAEDGHEPSYGVQSAWGSPILRMTDFIRDPHGPGWRLDRRRFDLRLRQAATQAGVALAEAKGITCIERDGERWQATVRGQTVAARWLVDATGRARSLARRQGGQRVQVDRLMGCVTVWAETEGERSDSDSTTLVEAAADGWWYTARLPDRRRVVVYHTDADLPTARHARTLEGYQALLGQTEYIQARLRESEYRPVVGPYMTAANSARLTPAVGPGWLAVGDAAVSFDPLSSQGILTALYLGIQAGEALVAYLNGAASTLDRYAAQVDAVYTLYEQRRLEYYGYERRWAKRLFWQRRRSKD